MQRDDTQNGEKRYEPGKSVLLGDRMSCGAAQSTTFCTLAKLSSRQNSNRHEKRSTQKSGSDVTILASNRLPRPEGTETTRDSLCFVMVDSAGKRRHVFKSVIRADDGGEKKLLRGGSGQQRERGGANEKKLTEKAASPPPSPQWCGCTLVRLGGARKRGGLEKAERGRG